jgi:hypothetical protein
MPIPSYSELVKSINWLLKQYSDKRWEYIQKKHSAARENQNWYKFLDFLYSRKLDGNLLRHKDYIFPVAIFHAAKPQRYDIESVLGNLDLQMKENVDPEFQKIGQVHIKQLQTADKKLWNGTTYRMVKFERDGRLNLDCALGTYFAAVSSQDIFESELLLNFAKINPSPQSFEEFSKKIVLRNHLHSLGDPFSKPVGMSSALSIDTAIIFAEESTFKVFLWERSEDVAVYPNLLQIIPSAMFQPAVNDFRREYSIKHNVYREYLEELFGLEEADRSKGNYAWNHFYDNPNLKYLKQLEEKGNASFYLTGVSVNLLQMRVGVCLLLLIKDGDWIVNHSTGGKVGELQLSKVSFNYEYKNTDELDITRFGALSLDLTKKIILPDYFKPQHFCPSAAATLKLAVDVAREEMMID